ncbi:type II toxin-antitoxin system Phd/YefM family antitoxin [Cyanobium sp. Morenito 9A2]|uniref:type II toxin-antitoxin system Phd/YefM family antitoxin n=1 Tax=Cyanobium sp. Morenito 9A2 TaxID=2823718 RepID=UPI0020CE4A6E|nr:type II toxin-antitoxin system prevent-host-death family antitoxin [Cyanobium sp. Morenito 9A2]MCP9848982.1 type II toxin-antitoxin system prevent-host-death family antitoxin [Cyanobium sp. Morenito 9A2]
MEPALPLPHPGPRLVNVHQAKTQLSRLIDAAHAGETIVLAKAGKPWARLMPLAPPPPQRVPGRLRSQGPLGDPVVLLEPMEADELASWDESSLISAVPHP